MVAVNISANYEGRPLQVLGNLIKERQRILGESAEDALVATGIDALVSLRALTRAAPQSVPKGDVAFSHDEPKYVTYPKGSYRRMIVRRWRDGKHVTKIKWQRVRNFTGTGKPKATQQERLEAWRRWGTINNAGLAKRALGVAMNKLSTRNVADNSNVRLSRIARANVRVMQYRQGPLMTLEIVDRLNYALAALKGGAASVDLALQRAANKIAGRLCKVAEAKLGETIATPFPEVKNRKAG